VCYFRKGEGGGGYVSTGNEVKPYNLIPASGKKTSEEKGFSRSKRGDRNRDSWPATWKNEAEKIRIGFSRRGLC